MTLLLPLLTRFDPLRPRTRLGFRILFALIVALLVKGALLTIVGVLMGPHWSWNELGRGAILLGASYALHTFWRRI